MKKILAKLVLFLLLGFMVTNPVKAQSDSTAKAAYLTKVEQMPEFPGGEEARYKFMAEQLQYPDQAKESGIQGTVYVSFVVTSTGELTEVKILRGIGGGCDEEVVRMVRSMPAWKPGYQDGKPVNVQFTMPCKFSLEDNQVEKHAIQGFGRLSMSYCLTLTRADFANDNKEGTSSELRFAALPNIEFRKNYRINWKISVYAGLNWNNVGVALKDSIVTKYRYLGFGIPFGVNFRMGSSSWAGRIGGGIIIPYQLKIKRYLSSGKQKEKELYSKQIQPVQPYVEFSLGYFFLQLRARYFLLDFFNTRYTKEVNGVTLRPYENLHVRPVEFGLVLGI